MSVDSVFVHKMWNDHELSKMLDGKDIPFPMLSDQNGNIGRLYGVYDEESGTETRGRFLIDPDGIVQAFEVMTPARSVSAQAISTVWGRQTAMPPSLKCWGTSPSATISKKR